MSCQRYATAIADHACGADLAPDVAAHLTACPACAALLVQQRRAITGLDDELQHMLTVERSPFFVQRVQAHVNTSPASRTWSAFWWSGLAAAAAVVIVATSMMMREPRGGPSQARPETPSQTQTTAANPPASSPIIRDSSATRPDPSPRAPGRRTPPSTVTATSVRAQAQPEVLVPAGQIQAVARYMALLRSGRLDTSSLEAKADEDSTPEELVLGALEIKPITVTEIDGTTSAVERRHQEEQPR
jgi:hypothetical protein